jgi:predicted nucleic acid-binding protein
MAVWREGAKRETIIVTSYWTFAEVFKAKCEGAAKPLDEEGDQKIEDLLRQRWIEPVLVDERIGVYARRLMRRYPECKKPTDAVHLASALIVGPDEMHTYDKSDLLNLNGQILASNTRPLTICTPRPIPPPPPPPAPLLDPLDKKDKPDA